MPHARAAQAREGGAAHLRESRRGAARRRHRPQQSRPHRPVLHHGQGGAALSAGAPRVPRRPHSALDLDRAAGPAAARRRHEHPGASASSRSRASRSTHLKHEALAGRPTSGYSPALTVGDFIFIPGITSLAVGDEPRRNGVAAAALMTEGAQWAGQPIKLETEFIITQAHGAVAGAGRRQARRRRARPGLSHRPRGLFRLQRGVVAALSAHRRRRSTSFPASTMASRPTTARSRSTCIALKPGGATKKRTIDAGVADRVPQPAAGDEGRRPACSCRA